MVNDPTLRVLDLSNQLNIQMSYLLVSWSGHAMQSLLMVNIAAMLMLAGRQCVMVKAGKILIIIFCYQI